MNNLLKYQNIDLGLLTIRIALGVIFIAHGWQKIANMTPVIGFFESLGFNSSLAYLVAFTELIAGACVVLGIFQKISTKAIIIIMLVAIYSVKFKMGFIGGYELDLALLAMAMGLHLTGFGKYVVKK